MNKKPKASKDLDKKSNPKVVKKKGMPLIYNAEIHDKMAIEVLSKGDFYEHLAKEAGVSVPTIKHWKKTYESFNEAVELGRDHGRGVWLKKPLERQENAFNTHYWHIVMRNIYHWGVEKIPFLLEKDARTPMNMLDLATLLLAEGKITNRVAKCINDLAMSKLKVQEYEELEKRISDLEKAAKSAASTSRK